METSLSSGQATPAAALPDLAMFEWDPAKSASNKITHSIDFDQATSIWKDGTRTWINLDRTVAVDLPAAVFAALERASGRTGTPIEDLIESWVEEKVGFTF